MKNNIRNSNEKKMEEDYNSEMDEEYNSEEEEDYDSEIEEDHNFDSANGIQNSDPSSNWLMLRMGKNHDFRANYELLTSQSPYVCRHKLKF